MWAVCRRLGVVCYQPLRLCAMLLCFSNVLCALLASGLGRLKAKHGSTVVTSFLAGVRSHFVMDPFDVALFAREGMDKFSFFEKALELECILGGVPAGQNVVPWCGPLMVAAAVLFSVSFVVLFLRC
jgi:hypothetical protein